MNREKALFVNHIHTEESDKRMSEKEGIWNYGEFNHSSDLLKIIEKLPENIDIVFNLTEHWGSNNKKYKKMEKRIVEKGGSFDYHDRHVTLELEGKRAAIINSVELSVEHTNSHFLICGLPLDNDRNFFQLSFEEFIKEAEKAEFAAPAHPFTPHYKVPDRMLNRFYEETVTKGIPTFIGFSSGYTKFFNRVSHGKYRRVHDFFNGVAKLRFKEFLNSLNPWKKPENLISISKKYDVPIVSEMDVHSILPQKLNGAGLIEKETIDELFEGNINTEKILNNEILLWDDVREGLSWKQFFETFPGLLFFYQHGFYRPFLPYTEDEFKEKFYESCKSLENISSEGLVKNSRDSYSLAKKIL